MTAQQAPTTWPLEPSIRTVAILGGTFDPPHRAHLSIARAAMESLGSGSGVVFVPASSSPFKVGQPVTPAKHRLAMVQLATEGEPQWGVWSDEIDRAEAGAASYMIDTVRRAIEATGGNLRPFLVIGADQALRFHEWKDARVLMSLAPPLVVMRAPTEASAVFVESMRALGVWSESELEVWGSRCVPMHLDNASSTAVRAAFRAADIAAIESMVPAAVVEYVAANKLYE